MHRPCNRINDEECMKIMHAERLPRVNNLVHFCKFSLVLFVFFCSIFVIPVAFLKCYVRVCDFTRQIRPLSSTVWKYFRNIVKTRLVYNPISIALSNSIVWKCFPWDGNILEIKLPYCGRGPVFQCFAFNIFYCLSFLAVTVLALESALCWDKKDYVSTQARCPTSVFLQQMWHISALVSVQSHSLNPSREHTDPVHAPSTQVLVPLLHVKLFDRGVGFGQLPVCPLSLVKK